MRKDFARLLACSSACGIAVGISAVAMAQGVATAQPTPEELASQNEAAPSEVTDEADIIVTGTQIRGIKPVGSNTVSQDRQQIEALGVNNTQQVIAQLPQSNFFLSIPEPGGTNIAQGTSRIPVNRPSLRNIPGFNSGTGQKTLVLIDGHRVVPWGMDQQAVDLAVVPQGIIERTEVILDGASAIYGSDAVEGVINLITRKRFDGTEVSGRLGIGDDYWQVSAGLTQGFTWGSGGVTFNYDFTKNSNILNRDRDYTAPIDYINFNPPQLRGVACDVPNVRANGTSGVAYTHRVEGGGIVAGPGYCNMLAYQTFTPAQEMHSGFVTLSQDISDVLKFEVSGLYSHRMSEANTGPYTGTVVVQPTSAFYRPGIAGAQQVAFNFAPVFGNDSSISRTTTEIWQVSPEITADVGSDWQVRLGGSYGESSVRILQNRLATSTLTGTSLTALANRTAAQIADPATTWLNPYDIAQTSPAVLNSLLRQLDINSHFTFKQARLIADGPLVALPGGDIRASVGAEWSQTRALVNKVDENTFARLAPATGLEENKSVFGEVVVPVFGPNNAVPGIQSLTFSASGRYDKYRKFDNFSPKLALTYEPTDWITIRGNWGKSFRAPNAMDDLGANQVLIRNVPAQFNPTVVAPGYTFSNNNGTTGYRYLYLTGTVQNLRPESATSWSVGFDVRPQLGPSTDVKLSASYWNIELKDTIAFAVIGSDPSVNFIIPGNPSQLCYLPGVAPVGGTVGPECSAQDVADFIALAPTGQGAYNSIISDGGTVAGLLDNRVMNLGGTKVRGVDVSASLRQETGFGSIDISANVAIPIEVQTTFYPGGPVTDEIEFNNPAWTGTASIGATAGNARGMFTVRHRPAFTPNPNTIRLASQTQIDALTIVDFSFRYEMPARDWFSDGATLSFNVNNMFNARPPLSLTANGGVTGGQTLGRVFVLGLTKKFGGPRND